MLARMVAEHIAKTYGFRPRYNGSAHPKLRFRLTRSEGMSPALTRTEFVLAALVESKEEQLVLLEQPKV